MNTRTVLLLIAVVFLAGLILFLWHTNARVDRELILAEAEAARIEEALEKVAQAAKEKLEELDQVKLETQAALEKSDRKIKQLQKENAEAQERTSRIEADKQELETRLSKLLTAEVDPDPQPIEEVLADGVNLYPGRDFSGAAIRANDQGLLLFQVMVEEITGRRSLGLQSDQLQAECEDQVARLQAVIQEHEARELAMGRSYQNQSQYIDLLEAENMQLKDWGRNLEAQVDLYRKRHSWPWLDKTEKLLALYGVYKIIEGVK